MVRGDHHAKARGRFTLDVDADRPVKIVFENHPGSPMRIDPDPAFGDGFVDQGTEIPDRDALGKLAGARRIARGPMPLLDVTEPAFGEDGRAVHVPEIAGAPKITSAHRRDRPAGKSEQAEQKA